MKRTTIKMEQLNLDFDMESSPGDTEQAYPQEVQQCIESLVHACECKEAHCHLPSCQKMKCVIKHTKICKRKANGDCSICKQLIALCWYHIKHCEETNCPVPFCCNVATD